MNLKSILSVVFTSLILGHFGTFSIAQGQDKDPDFDPVSKGILNLETGKYRQPADSEPRLHRVFAVYHSLFDRRTYIHARIFVPLEKGNPAGYTFDEKIYFADFDGPQILFEEMIGIETIKLSSKDKPFSIPGARVYLNGEHYTYGGPEIIIEGDTLGKLQPNAFYFIQTETGIMLRNLAHDLGINLKTLSDIWSLSYASSSRDIDDPVTRRALLDAIVLNLKDYPKLSKYRNLDKLAQSLIERQGTKNEKMHRAGDRVIANFVRSGARLRKDGDQCGVPFGE